MLPELMTVKELREYLRCSQSIAYSLVKERNFPSIHIGGKWFVMKDGLLAWLEDKAKQKK